MEVASRTVICTGYDDDGACSRTVRLTDDMRPDTALCRQHRARAIPARTAPTRAEPKIRLQVMIPVSLQQWINAKADAEGRSMWNVVGELLERGKASVLDG